MNGDGDDDDQGDDGEPEQFDPAAVFAAWKGARPAALAELADDAAAVKAAHRRLSMLGVKSAANPFVVTELPAPVVTVAKELTEGDREAARKRLDLLRDPKTDWRRDWRQLVPRKAD